MERVVSGISVEMSPHGNTLIMNIPLQQSLTVKSKYDSSYFCVWISFLANSDLQSALSFTLPSIFRYDESLRNSFPDDAERVLFLLMLYQLLLHGRWPWKRPKMVLTGPPKSGKTSWLEPILAVLDRRSGNMYRGKNSAARASQNRHNSYGLTNGNLVNLILLLKISLTFGIPRLKYPSDFPTLGGEEPLNWIMFVCHT